VRVVYKVGLVPFDRGPCRPSGGILQDCPSNTGVDASENPGGPGAEPPVGVRMTVRSSSCGPGNTTQLEVGETGGAMKAFNDVGLPAVEVLLRQRGADPGERPSTAVGFSLFKLVKVCFCSPEQCRLPWQARR
jgi:hypothetical protein